MVMWRPYTRAPSSHGGVGGRHWAVNAVVVIVVVPIGLVLVLSTPVGPVFCLPMVMTLYFNPPRSRSPSSSSSVKSPELTR